MYSDCGSFMLRGHLMPHKLPLAVWEQEQSHLQETADFKPRHPAFWSAFRTQTIITINQARGNILQTKAKQPSFSYFYMCIDLIVSLYELRRQLSNWAKIDWSSVWSDVAVSVVKNWSRLQSRVPAKKTPQLHLQTENSCRPNGKQEKQLFDSVSK